MSDDAPLPERIDRRDLWRLIALARPWRWTFALCLLLALAATACELAVPWITKLAIDHALVAAQVGGQAERHILLHQLAAALGVLLVVRFATGTALAWLLQAVGQRILAALRDAVVARLIRLPVAFYDREAVGRLVTRATNDVTAVNELFTGVLVTVVRDVLLIAGGLGLLLALEWRLALAVVACTPLVLLIAIAFRRRARDNYRALRAVLARLNAFLAESISGWRTVQACAQEPRMQERFDAINAEEYRAGFEQLRIAGLFMPLLACAGSVTVAVVLWIGGHGVLGGWLTIGGLVAFMGYIELVFAPIRELAEKHNLTLAATAAGERIFRLLDQPAEDAGGTMAPPRLGRIACEDVWFRYSGADGRPGPWVLQGVSFAIAPGERIALVGATGSGKSTIAGLLLRFHDPERGRITADGSDLRACPRAWLRSRIATVAQEVHLYAGSVAENLALFAPAGRELLAQATATVHADAAIMRLPGGLDHHLGEGGGRLSAGERQLLALARAVVHDPELLILDEATAHIDSRTEALVQDGLARLLAGRSALIIAHRLSTIRACDRILVLHHGRLAEQGTHAELLAAGGLYADLHQRFVAEEAMGGNGPEDGTG